MSGLLASQDVLELLIWTVIADGFDDALVVFDILSDHLCAGLVRANPLAIRSDLIVERLRYLVQIFHSYSAIGWVELVFYRLEHALLEQGALLGRQEFFVIELILCYGCRGRLLLGDIIIRCDGTHVHCLFFIQILPII